MRTVKIILILFILAFSADSFSQYSNLIVFSEQGERFSVVLNGILQNASPETNVKVTGLTAPQYKLKVIFEEKTIPDIDKNLMFPEEDAEFTFVVKKNNKGEYVVRFMSQSDIAHAEPESPAQTIVGYTTVPPAVNTNITQTTTTVNVGTDVVNMNVSMNTGVSTTTTTTMTSTSSGTISGSGIMKESQKPYVMPGYSGPVGCPYPMTDLDFQNVKETIASKSFEDSKLTIAKQVVSSTCLFASEVKQMMELFDFESTRLEFAKYAYKYTFDLGNYYKVNSAFQFESSIDDLNRYIEHQRH